MDYRERQIQKNIMTGVIALVTVLLILGYLLSPNMYDIGDTVEDFTLPTLDGEDISLYEFKDSFFLIEFFHTEKITNENPPERIIGRKKKEDKYQRFAGFQDESKVNRAQRAFTNTQMLDFMIEKNADIVFLSINVGQDRETVKKFVEKCNKPWYVFLDRKKQIYKKFFENQLPGYVILDKNKELLYRIEGWSGLVVSVIYTVLKDNGLPVIEPEDRKR